MFQLLSATKTTKRLANFVETAVFGTTVREKMLVNLLQQFYSSRFRRLWSYAEELPHFMDHRLGAFLFLFGKAFSSPYAYFRGFFSAELLRDGDRLLDIGCGDGFFDRKFFSDRCAQIDAVDIEPEAIKAAQKNHQAPNIRFHHMDAVAQAFPSKEYDVVVWDGAIGHFPEETTHTVLSKIAAALTPTGVFTGSETLGREEGHDHLQFFMELEDLRKLLEKHFKVVELRELSYPIGYGSKTLRREAYWRCSQSPERLDAVRWRRGVTHVGMESS